MEKNGTRTFVDQSVRMNTCASAELEFGQEFQTSPPESSGGESRDAK